MSQPAEFSMTKESSPRLPTDDIEVPYRVRPFSTGSILPGLRATLTLSRMLVGFISAVLTICYVGLRLDPTINPFVSPACSSPATLEMSSICGTVFHSTPKYPELLRIQSASSGILEGSTPTFRLLFETQEVRNLEYKIRATDPSDEGHIADQLAEISEHSLVVAQSLQRLGSRVRGAVTDILNANNRTFFWLMKLDRLGVVSLALKFGGGLEARIRQELGRSFLVSANVTIERFRIIGDGIQQDLVGLNQLESKADSLRQHIWNDQRSEKMDYNYLITPLLNIFGYRPDAISLAKNNMKLLDQMSADRQEIRKRLTKAHRTICQLTDQVVDLVERFVHAENVDTEGVVPLETFLNGILGGMGEMERTWRTEMLRVLGELLQPTPKQKRPIQAIINRT